MKQNNKLNTALRDALQEHTEPLREVQWDRLSAALGKEKPKKRFLPWFFVVFFIGLTCLATGFWFGHSANGQQDMANEATQQASAEVLTGKNSLQSPDKVAATDADFKKAGAQDGFNSGMTPKLPVLKDNRGLPEGELDYQDRLHHDADKSQGSGFMSGPGSIGAGGSDQDITGTGNPAIPETSSGDFLTMMQIKKIKTAKLSDSLPLMGYMQPYKRNTIPKHRRPERSIARFTLGLSSGISPVHFSIAGIQHEEKIHKDSREIFDKSNRYSKSYYGNFNFEWMVSKRLPVYISTGLQYRQIIQDVNLSYDLEEIAWRGVDGEIQYYYHDSTPLQIKYANRNFLDFISIPFKVAYMKSLGGRNELQFSGGVNISVLARTKGSSFSINEGEIKPLKDSYKHKLNAGLIGGLQYNRNLWQGWWLGVEAQWQRNTLNYDVQYGVIRSRISISSYNLNIKYKF